jgi:hypothetical protein
MLKNILKLDGAQELSKNEQANILGGVTREEYCSTLSGMLLGGGYQGDISMGMGYFYQHCGSHGIPLYPERIE